uniref:Uncharacterized protein n=1 Tax=Oryza barthii TaxID=65489 RepID=A0A0D3ERN2_9ORYZ
MVATHALAFGAERVGLAVGTERFVGFAIYWMPSLLLRMRLVALHVCLMFVYMCMYVFRCTRVCLSVALHVHVPLQHLPLGQWGMDANPGISKPS